MIDTTHALTIARNHGSIAGHNAGVADTTSKRSREHHTSAAVANSIRTAFWYIAGTPSADYPAVGDYPKHNALLWAEFNSAYIRAYTQAVNAAPEGATA